MSVLLVFVDGVGIGPDDAAVNPFAAAPPPALTALLDGARIAGHESTVSAARATLVPLDAQLGVPGLPQSGTGQYSLLTGANGAREFGRHYGPWVPTALRAPLQQTNILARAKAAGRRVAFANAYPEELVESARGNGSFKAIGPLRAGPPLAAAGAGVLDRHTQHVKNGRALTSEITNETWRERLHRHDLPYITPHVAGHTLARLAREHDLTLYAHYATDYAGHEQDMEQAVSAVALVDEFVEGLLDALHADTTVLIVSDHGNLEDVRTGHTKNPALGIIIGPQHQKIATGMTSLLDVTPTILSLLGVQ